MAEDKKPEEKPALSKVEGKEEKPTGISILARLTSPLNTRSAILGYIRACKRTSAWITTKRGT